MGAALGRGWPLTPGEGEGAATLAFPTLVAKLEAGGGCRRDGMWASVPMHVAAADEIASSALLGKQLMCSANAEIAISSTAAACIGSLLGPATCRSPNNSCRSFINSCRPRAADFGGIEEVLEVVAESGAAEAPLPTAELRTEL